MAIGFRAAIQGSSGTRGSALSPWGRAHRDLCRIAKAISRSCGRSSEHQERSSGSGPNVAAIDGIDCGAIGSPPHGGAEMIGKILDFSLRQRAVVLLGAIALLAAGLWSALHLPIDAVPDITGIQVQINTEVAALAAEESEKLVTQVIEREMAGLPGMEEMRSLTKFGLSQVTLNFTEDTDIFRARQLVAERLQ